MTKKLETKTIAVLIEKRGKRGTEDVEAVIYGQVAVHKDIPVTADEYGYSVSHIASGYAIISGLKKASAKKVAYELKKLGFDFDAYAANGYDKETPLYQEAKTVVVTWGERW